MRRIRTYATVCVWSGPGFTVSSLSVPMISCRSRLKSNVWAYVLCGGRVDIAEIVEELETSGELQKADDADTFHQGAWFSY